MRPMHGSMMDAAGSRPDDLGRAHGRLAAAALPDAAHPRRVPWPLVPMARAQAAHAMWRQVAMSRSAQAMQAAAALPALAVDPQALQQMVALSGALAQQWMTLQAQWLDGLTELGQEAGELRQANTVSKYVDQEMNLVQQGLALVTAQSTATARLMENLQVNLAWWLSQRADPPV